MRILITGGTGFIGSHLTNHFSDEGHEVIVVGTKTEQSPRAAKYLGLTLGGFDFNRLQRLGKIDVCFHQAANNDTLDLDRDEMMWANVESPKKFLKEVCSLNGCRKIIYASSAAVYGSSPAPYKEGETKENPLNPYGESKVEFDKWATTWPASGDFWGDRVSVVGLRYTNVYGPGEEHKGKRASMIHQLIKTMKKGDSPNLFWDGTQQRDWVYIEDVIRANIAAMAFQGTGIFNCGSGKATSFNTLVDVINEKLGTDIHPNWIDCPFKTAYQEFTQADMTKAKEELGFVPAYDIKRGISEFLDGLDGKTETS
jgi:ADP-L-glycero-D-manno-heptose 6-epimerase